MEHVVQVEQLSKIYHKKNQVSNRYSVRNAINKFIPPHGLKQAAALEDFAALSNLSFELEKGDVLGITGRNGAGKSTVLKIMAGVVKPTGGRVIYRGNMTSILDFGTGFHPDLTGKENIFFTGALLGMQRLELHEKFKKIVDFSEIGEFLDMPVKHYSSGMYLRLAFSVYSQIRSDILLLDEMIAVGDFAFRQKCYTQITQLAKSGTTVIMVSHNPEQIQDLCNKCLWLEKGSNHAFGDSAAIMENYISKYISTGNHTGEVNHYYVNWLEPLNIKDEILLRSVGIRGHHKTKEEAVAMTDELCVEMMFDKLHGEFPVEITISVRSIYEAWIMVDSFSFCGQLSESVKQAGSYSCSCIIPAGILNHGTYQLGCLVSMREELIYQNAHLLHFRLDFAEKAGLRNHLAKAAKSLIQPLGKWKIQKL